METSDNKERVELRYIIEFSRTSRSNTTYNARSPDFLRCLDTLGVSSFVLEVEEEEVELGSIRATTKRTRSEI